MKNLKAIIIIVILLLVGFLAVVGIRAARTYLGGAAGGTEPTNVRAQADVKSATISWQTEKESQGVVEYGTTPASLLLRALETQQTMSHRVILSPLKENTTYYFRIKVGETIYDNNGIPFSFKTQEDEGETPTAAPTVQVSTSTPTPATGSGNKVARCVMSEFKEKFGTSDSQYDFDNNGVVNSKDWIECLNANK